MLGALRGLVDLGRNQPVGLDAGLLQKLDPSRRARGQHKLLENAHPGPSAGAGSRPFLLEAVGDAALGQVVGRHLDQDLVASEHANAVLGMRRRCGR